MRRTVSQPWGTPVTSVAGHAETWIRQGVVRAREVSDRTSD
jgi:hypothetical protein